MKRVIGLALSFVLAAGAANANVVTATYSGLASGFDNGLLGGMGTFTNSDFVAAYSFNEGADISAPGQFLGLALTIQGVTFNVDASHGIGGDGVVPGYFRTSSVVSYGVGDLYFLEMDNSLQSDLTPATRVDAYTSTGINFQHEGPGEDALYAEGYIGGGGTFSYIRFHTTEVSVASIAAPPPPANLRVGPGGIPEPSTWALAVAGMGGAGALLRRRRGRPSLSAIG